MFCRLILIPATLLALAGCSRRIEDICDVSQVLARDVRATGTLIDGSPHGSAFAADRCDRGFKFDIDDSAPGAAKLSAFRAHHADEPGEMKIDATARIKISNKRRVFKATEIHGATFQPLSYEDEGQLRRHPEQRVQILKRAKPPIRLELASGS